MCGLEGAYPGRPLSRGVSHATAGKEAGASARRPASAARRATAPCARSRQPAVARGRRLEAVSPLHVAAYKQPDPAQKRHRSQSARRWRLKLRAVSNATTAWSSAILATRLGVGVSRFRRRWWAAVGLVGGLLLMTVLVDVPAAPSVTITPAARLGGGPGSHRLLTWPARGAFS